MYQSRGMNFAPPSRFGSEQRLSPPQPAFSDALRSQAFHAWETAVAASA